MVDAELLKEYGRSTDATDNDEVIIGKYPYRVIGTVQPQNLGRWQTKITIGDPTYDSDPLMSAWSLASLAGGQGNFILKEGVDDETYWTGTMETRYPHLLTNLPKTWDYDGGEYTGTARAVGDFPAHAPMFHAAFGDELLWWDKTEQKFKHATTLPAAPVNKGVEYNGKLFIPLGSSGLVAWDGDTLDTTNHISIEAIDLTIYDNKLAAITRDGYLRIMLMDESWEPISDQQKLPSGWQPTGVQTFIDQQGNPAIFIITTQGMWVYDRQNQVLIQTHLQYPRHPFQGKASAVFRGESLYVSVGIGIHGYNGNTVNAMGPDYRYGLPANLRGYITDMEQEYNGLLVLIQGANAAERQTPDGEITPPTYRSREARFSTPETVSTVLRWNQMGWHPVWKSDSAAGTPTNIYVSSADGEYRVWWGYNGRMYTQTLPIAFHNPKVGMQIGQDAYAERGELITGWFDANMSAYDKLASHVELVIEDVFGDGTPLGEVTVQYQIDNAREDEWITLRTVKGVGRYVMPFNTISREDGSSFSRGTRFNRIRFRILSVSASLTVTPLIQNLLLKFIKLPITQWSWTITVDLAHNEGYKGIPNETLSAYLNSLIDSGSFTRFVHRDKEYRVRIAQTQGHEAPGMDDRGRMTVTVAEVMIPPDDASDIEGYVEHRRVG